MSKTMESLKVAIERGGGVEVVARRAGLAVRELTAALASHDLSKEVVKALRGVVKLRADAWLSLLIGPDIHPRVPPVLEGATTRFVQSMMKSTRFVGRWRPKRGYSASLSAEDCDRDVARMVIEAGGHEDDAMNAVLSRPAGSALARGVKWTRKLVRDVMREHGVEPEPEEEWEAAEREVEHLARRAGGLLLVELRLTGMLHTVMIPVDYTRDRATFKREVKRATMWDAALPRAAIFPAWRDAMLERGASAKVDP